MRILVLRGGALGDFLVALPAIAQLRRRWPDARLELAGNRSAATLAVNCGLLDAVHSQHEARWAALYGDAPLADSFAAWLAEFDLVVSFWPDPQLQLQRRLPVRSGQQFIAAAAHPVVAPAAAHYCDALASFALPAVPLVYPLRTHRPDGRTIALHPGSGSTKKNWPLDRWVGLARWLKLEQGQSVVAITGEAEAGGLLADECESFHLRPLDEVADLLARCQLFIGHDSGISHLAAAAGAPCLLLFGPTDPRVWAPPAPGVRVIQQGADLASISLSEVQLAVASLLTDQG